MSVIADQCFLVSSPPPTRVECASRSDAMARLRDVIQSQRLLSNEVVELPSGRWLIRDRSGGSKTIWIENSNGMTVLLKVDVAE